MKLAYLSLFILLLILSVFIFFKYPAMALDMVRLGKVGEMSNNYGAFKAVKVKEIKGVNYAFCATSKGMAVYSIHYVNDGQEKTSTEVALISFVPIGDCNGIEIVSGGFEKNIYAYITAGDKGLYIRNVTNPAFSYHIGSYDTPSDARGVAVSGGYAYVADYTSGLQVIDITDPTGPVGVGTWDTLGYAYGVAVSGNHAYMADARSGLQVIDITDPTGPVRVGTWDTPGSAYGVAVSGGYAYVADYTSGLQVIDITDPTGPMRVGTWDTLGYAYGVAVSGNHAYVADYTSGLQVIDITDPTGLVRVGTWDTPGWAHGVVVLGDHAYLADGESGLQVIDITDPTGPVRVGTWDTPDDARGVAVSGNHAYVADGYSGLQVIDITDPIGPVRVGTCDTPDDARGVAVSGNHAYVADYTSGLQVIDITDPTGPVRVGTCDTPSVAFGVAVSGDYAYVADWKYGLHVIDISDPANPMIAGICDTPGVAFGVAVSGDYAYMSDMWGYGLQVIDITNPAEPTIAGICDAPVIPFGVAVSEGYAYVADRSGLQVIDITDPTGPVRVGTWNTPGSARGVALSVDHAYVADGYSGLQVIDITDLNGPVRAGSSDTPHSAFKVVVLGGYAYVADWKNGLEVIDITDLNGPVKVGSWNTPGFAYGVAVSGRYAYVADHTSGLQVIDITDPTGPMRVGSWNTPSFAYGVAVSGRYAYVADYTSGLQVIDITDPTEPMIAGSCDTPGHARGVAVSGGYAYVADYTSGLQVIDITNPRGPVIVGSWDTPSDALGIAVSGDYAYVVDGESGLQVIDITDPTEPVRVGGWDTLGWAHGVAVLGDHAYLADGESGLQVIDITDPNGPLRVGSCDTPGYARGVTVSEDYAYVADDDEGLLKFKINIGPPPSGKGNLILVAGGDINYRELSRQTTSSLIRKKVGSFDPAESKLSYWQIIQTLANHVFKAFIDQGYEVYEIYYFNPDPAQDIEGACNTLIVDEFIPTREKLQSVIEQFPEDHLANEGPLFIYLLGHGAEGCFLVAPGEVIRAEELRESIKRFQKKTNRQVVLIMESAASGTFIERLKDSNIPNLTIITSTNDGASYIKPGGPNILYQSFTTAFIDFMAPSVNSNEYATLDPESISAKLNSYLEEAFHSTRNELERWAHEGKPFENQAPQMALPDDKFTSLYFSQDGKRPIHELSLLSIDQNCAPCLTLIGKSAYTHDYAPLRDSMLSSNDFFYSDRNVLVLERFTGSRTDLDPNLVWYTLIPRKNGRLTLIAHGDPYLLLSAQISIEVSLDDPDFFTDTGKMALIIAGYSGSGDYLFESTNTIANHAYKTLRAMGYTKHEIFYYNPYFLQDLDGNEKYDDIVGYPKIEIFDPNTDPNSPYSPFARIMQKDVKELFLFLVDHGDKYSFCLNPSENGTLDASYLLDRIVGSEGSDGIVDKISDKIVLLYDACYSGSFLTEIEKRSANSEMLGQKLITITSTDSNQTAYFLNKGVVSFSYPFFDEWFLTNSLTDAFSFARDSLPLKEQDPNIFNADLADTWDKDSRYYVDESRPSIDNVYAYRKEGDLHISANVFSLSGVARVWAIVKSNESPVSTLHGKAITEATELIFSYDPNDGYTDPNLYGGHFKLITDDPCPNEGTYQITVYAMDKSSRPKISFYDTGIDDTGGENKTKALIIYTDPKVLTANEKEKLNAQVNRAKAILECKGLKREDGDIVEVSGEDITGPNNLPDIFPLAEDQTLFIYLIGQTVFKGDTLYFNLNPNSSLTPEELYDYLSLYADNRLLILMDSPFSSQFLAEIDTNNQHENWAHLASTDQDGLFFPIKGSEERRFPCFSHFFFSLTLSGATVAQAYRMADRAVSLTGQNPQCFLPKKDKYESAYHINRHLSYYLGTSAIPGENYSLLTNCTARYVSSDSNYSLSFTAPASVELNRAWAVLISSPSSFFQDIDVVDFDLKERQMNNEGALYSKDFNSGQKYYKAHIMVEGKMEGDDEDKNWIDGEEIPIVHPSSSIEEDGYEPDDPNGIIGEQDHRIIVNTLPIRRTFYCEECEPGGICTDYDWMYFYAQAGHAYEICAQDLSELGYFIRIALYDPNIQFIPQDPNKPNGHFLIDKDFLTFICKESGNYLIETRLASSYPVETRLASSYPDEGVGYILSVTDPQAEKYTPSEVWVIDTCSPPRNNLSVRIINNENEEEYISYDGISNYDDPNYRWIFSFNDSKPWEKFTIEVYQGIDQEIDKEEDIIAFLSADIDRSNLPCTLNIRTIDLSPVSCYPDSTLPELPYRCAGIDPNCTTDWVTRWKSVIEKGFAYPFSEGDKDPDFPLTGDYDGDGIINNMEYYLDTSPINHTIILSLHKGDNLFYFPAIAGMGRPHTVPIDVLKKLYHFRDHNEGRWQEHNYIKSHKFNALNASTKGLLYLDIADYTLPVLCLKGFPCSNDAKLFDPTEFNQNESTITIKKALNNLEQVEAINCQNRSTGLVNSTYRFFGEIAGDDSETKPDNVYIFYKKRCSIP